MKCGRFMIVVMVLLIFLTGCRTMTPLSKASSNGDVRVMKELIQKGANLNEPGETSYKATALHWAASNGQEEAVKALLNAGADINSMDYCQQTPIFYAMNSASKNNIQVIKLLIDKGADLNILDCSKGMPIDYAMRNQNLTQLELIIAKNPQSLDRLKKTRMAEGSYLDLPINIGNCRMELETNKATISANMPYLEDLIRAGWDLDEADCFGYRPIDYAKRYQADEAINLINAKVSKSVKGDRDFPKGKWDDSINFSRAVPKIDYQGTKSLAVNVNDQRPYIVNKDKKECYVGYTRYNAGPPKDMTTRDRRPVDQTIAMLIAEGYRSFAHNVVSITYGSENKLSAGAAQSKADRVIKLILNDWMIETQFWAGHIEVKYNMDVLVTDAAGINLFSKKISGKESIAAHNSAPYERAIIISPEVLYYLLTDILNKPEVKAALL